MYKLEWNVATVSYVWSHWLGGFGNFPSYQSENSIKNIVFIDEFLNSYEIQFYNVQSFS